MVVKKRNYVYNVKVNTPFLAFEIFHEVFGGVLDSENLFLLM